MHTESIDAGEDKLPLKTRLFLLSKNAELEWSIFSRVENTLTNLVEIRDTLSYESAKTPLRFEVIYNTTPVIFSLALHLLENIDTYPKIIIALHHLSLSLWARKPADKDYLRDRPTVGSSLVWTTLINCFRLMKEVKHVSQHDFNSVSSLADFILRIYILDANGSSGGAKLVPIWFYKELQSLGIVEVSASAALTELHSLFAKKYHQLVAIWSVEKASHEWDSQLQRTYKFEYLRRSWCASILIYAR